MGALRNALSEGILGRFISHTDKQARNEFDGGRNRRRLKSWQPTQNTVNVILAQYGAVLRSRCRDALRNNPHAVSAVESFSANVIGTGIKPSSLLQDNPDLRQTIMELWLDWTDLCDADGIADFYGMQTIVARALFEAGECFVRFRPRKAEDGMLVPLQIQLLESEMCPYDKNERAASGNYIMNGIELDLRGKRVAYWFHQIHPGDVPLETESLLDPVRVPASEVLHIFKCTRPGQMRGVPLVTPALVRMFLLDQYDDAELERKRIAAMFAGFITSAVPEDILPIDGEDVSAPQEGIALSGLEPGTMQTLLPGEDIKFSEPADVGGTYEAYQYRQQLAMFAALGIPYSIATSDLRRANYSSLRGSIVEYRRKLEQFQHNVFVFQMCAPIWKRWMDTAILSQALPIGESEYLLSQPAYQRVKWIPQRNDWVDPLKDRQAEKLAVDAGFKSRSDVIEAEGSDPEENDQRIAADQERAERLDLVFAVHTAAATQPLTPSEQAAQDAKDQEAADAAAEAADNAASDNADNAAAQETIMRQWYSMKADDTDTSTAEIVIYDEIGKSWWDDSGVGAKQFLDDLNALGDIANITLRINSPGGDVFDGVAIHNSIKNHKAKVTAHIDGIAASAASFIAMAADKIVMPSNSFMLIHGASGISFGNADDMRAVADDLDRIDKSLTATYVTRAKSTTAKVKALMKEDRLMDAAEAKQWGFADEVTSEKKMAAKFSLRLLPKAAAEKFVAVNGDGQGDPPPPAPEPEVSEGLPVAAPTPTIQEPDPKPAISEPTNVVNLDVAKQQGMDEHKAYVASITDLCTLAAMPERVGTYIRASTSVDDVRKELLDLRAKQEPVMPHNPLQHHAPNKVPASSAWSKITDALNARK